jgi:hypothetical protein
MTFDFCLEGVAGFMSTVALHFVDLLNHINFISVIAAFVS